MISALNVKKIACSFIFSNLHSFRATNPNILISSPVSSFASLITACSKVSLVSTAPPGRDQLSRSILCTIRTLDFELLVIRE
ncbi:hypothetical protein D3C78_1216760 [compost metagenome]